MPEADRRLIDAPIHLALEPDMEALRRRLGTVQAKIGQAPDATKGGNATKRIRLRLEGVHLSERCLISGCFGHAARLRCSMVSWS